MNFFKSLIVAFIALLASTNFVTAQTTATVQTAENIKTLTVKVKGVGCSNDCKTICTNVYRFRYARARPYPNIPPNTHTTTKFRARRDQNVFVNLAIMTNMN